MSRASTATLRRIISSSGRIRAVPSRGVPRPSPEWSQRRTHSWLSIARNKSLDLLASLIRGRRFRPPDTVPRCRSPSRHGGPLLGQFQIGLTVIPFGFGGDEGDDAVGPAASHQRDH